MHEREISSKNLLKIIGSIYSTRKFEEVNYDFDNCMKINKKKIEVYLVTK